MKRESTGRKMRPPPPPARLSKQVTKSYALLYAADITAQKENKEVHLCFWFNYLLCPWKDYDIPELEQHRAI